MEGVSALLSSLLQDVNGLPFRDNLLEYVQYVQSLPNSSMVSPCYQFTRPPHTPIEITVYAHADDVALFWSDESKFYYRCVKDLDSLTKILHSRYYCCIHICRESQNVQRHMVATLRLDDIITFLEWIVSQYVVIKPSGYVAL
jgi:hypothetical protein